MLQVREASEVLVSKPEDKILPGRPGSRWKDNMALK
jgi:hypothetical protein